MKVLTRPDLKKDGEGFTRLAKTAPPRGGGPADGMVLPTRVFGEAALGHKQNLSVSDRMLDVECVTEAVGAAGCLRPETPAVSERKHQPASVYLQGLRLLDQAAAGTAPPHCYSLICY